MAIWFFFGWSHPKVVAVHILADCWDLWMLSFWFGCNNDTHATWQWYNWKKRDSNKNGWRTVLWMGMRLRIMNNEYRLETQTEREGERWRTRRGVCGMSFKSHYFYWNVLFIDSYNPKWWKSDLAHYWSTATNWKLKIRFSTVIHHLSSMQWWQSSMHIAHIVLCICISVSLSAAFSV